MQRAFWLLTVCGVTWSGIVRADDQAAMKELVRKAIQAHGGAANLAHFAGATWKGQGKLYWQGGQTVYSVTGARQHGRAALLAVEGETEGTRFQLVRVLNGDQGWVRLNGKVQDLDAPALAEERERLYANWIGSLVPLLGDQCQLAPAGPLAVQGKPATGVRVSFPGCREVTLYFDDESFLLVKKTVPIHDLARQGAEILQETYYFDYTVVEGVQTARKQQVRWDGKPYLDLELTEIKPLLRLPETLFFRPTPN